MNWYSKIYENMDNIPSAIDYFNTELDEAKKEIKIYGSIEQQASHLPSIVDKRFSQLQEIEAILEYLNIEFRKIRSKTFRKYFEHYNRALSSREVEKYIDSDDDVLNYSFIINDVAFLRNKWLGIIKGLEIKHYQLNAIIKLRVAGLEDANI